MRKYQGFPVEISRAVLREEGSEDVLRYFNFPKSMADIQCQTSLEYGQGRYSIEFEGFLIKRSSFAINNDDYQCPYQNHCLGNRRLQVSD